MVIYDFNAFGVSASLYEAQPVLIVDADAVLSGSFPGEGFQ
jgi:hypothetical protein